MRRVSGPGVRHGGPAEGIREGGRARSVAHLRLAVARRVDGLLAGERSGLRAGPGDELDQVRDYEPGDDVRRMDWAVTARTGRPAVRTSVAEHEQQLTLVVDLTPSMVFGTVDRTKLEVAAVVVAAVGHVSAGPGNTVRGVLVRSTGVQFLPVGPCTPAVARMVHAVWRTPVQDATPGRAAVGAGTDPLSAALDTLAHRPGRPGLVVVVTDLVGGPSGTDPDPLRSPLRRLAARHDVLVVEVLDPRELELPDVGFLHLVDPETGATAHVNTSDRRLRSRYAAASAERRAHRRDVLRRSGCAHLSTRTDGDWLRDLAHHLAGRRRTRGGAGSARGPA